MPGRTWVLDRNTHSSYRESHLRPRIILPILLVLALVTIGYPSGQFVLGSPSIEVPAVTDDSLDPIDLMWTGYAPAWWVAANLNGWSDTAYCSSSKTINGVEYNYTLELTDGGASSCIGPRDHVRIWDMGYSPTFGRWSIGAAHHEHTVCFPCHHVIDSWERAEADIRSTFAIGQYTKSISNFSLPNPGYYQSAYNDGNATLIQMKPPPAQEYPVVFNENGLGNGTSWSITLDGETSSSQLPDIVFFKPNGTFTFTVNPVPEYAATPSSGRITVAGSEVRQGIDFRIPWTTSSRTIHRNLLQSVTLSFAGNATVNASTAHLTGTYNPRLGFNATEIGPRGVLNLTIPKSIALPLSSVEVTIDSVRDLGAKVSSDANNYYVSISFLYGNHSIDLAFNSPLLLYILCVTVGALLTGTLGILVLVRASRKPIGRKATSEQGTLPGPTRDNFQMTNQEATHHEIRRTLGPSQVSARACTVPVSGFL